jgi:basic amino acid/polyamine antiporter, APA family
MSQETPQLRRELGLWDAIVMGMGSIIGTGVFVSIGIAVGIAGASVIGAIAIAAVVAVCNGLSAAQLAANHPVSGGTYEYGYRYLNPDVGFIAGWLFLLAKSASAATAALGFAGYLLSAFQIARNDLIIPIALITVITLTILVLEGIQKSNRVNAIVVSITLFSLLFFVLAGLPKIDPSNFNFVGGGSESLGIFHASALMFVSYTGYGRITTMSEEVRNPRETIPRAIIVTLILTMVLYIAISIVGIGVAGVDLFSLSAYSKAAPLEVVARYFTVPGSSQILAIGAVTAMLGVLLNLILGLSRVLLAMGRRGDMPRIVARLNAAQTAPTVAVIVVGSAIAGLVLIGNVKTTWSFSAFNVLVYYALTNLAALRMTTTERLYPRWTSGLGLVSCAFLAFWVEPEIWLTGLGLIAVGLGWKRLVAR